jgi:hypothetical protein
MSEQREHREQNGWCLLTCLSPSLFCKNWFHNGVLRSPATCCQILSDSISFAWACSCGVIKRGGTWCNPNATYSHQPLSRTHSPTRPTNRDDTSSLRAKKKPRLSAGVSPAWFSYSPSNSSRASITKATSSA